MSEAPQRSAPAAVALGASAVVACLMPMFLTGAMAVQLTEALGFGTVGLGAAVALGRAAPAALSPYLGRLADELGATRSIRLAGLGAATACMGVALGARSWLTFVVWIMLSGIANSLSQPAANRLLANVVRDGRLGLAFGLKQSAPPMASALAGLSVPLIAISLGWRWAFVGSAVLGLLVSFAARPGTPRIKRPRAERRAARVKLVDRRVLLGLAVAFGLATGASSALTTFYVDAAVPAGLSPQTAGYLFAIGSGVAILVRIATGIACDRIYNGHLKLCAVIIGSGSLGFAFLSLDSPRFMVVGILIAMMGAWGFNAVFWYAIVRAYPKSPGQLTGAIFPGGLLGATLGPLVFGIVASRFGYPTMWTAVAVLSLIGAIALWRAAKGLPDRGAVADEGTV